MWLWTACSSICCPYTATESIPERPSPSRRRARVSNPPLDVVHQERPSRHPQVVVARTRVLKTCSYCGFGPCGRCVRRCPGPPPSVTSAAVSSIVSGRLHGTWRAGRASLQARCNRRWRFKRRPQHAERCPGRRRASRRRRRPPDCGAAVQACCLLHVNASLSGVHPQVGGRAGPAGVEPARARHTLMSNKRSSMEWVPCHSFSLSR